MFKVATLVTLIPLMATPAYARSHCHHYPCHQTVRATPYYALSPDHGLPIHGMAGGYMPGAGEISGNTGGYAHPEGAGTTSAP